MTPKSGSASRGPGSSRSCTLPVSFFLELVLHSQAHLGGNGLEVTFLPKRLQQAQLKLKPIDQAVSVGRANDPRLLFGSVEHHEISAAVLGEVIGQAPVKIMGCFNISWLQ